MRVTIAIQSLCQRWQQRRDVSAAVTTV